MTSNRKRLAHPQRVDMMLQRLCRQLIETHGDFAHTVLMGLQPRGVVPARRIQQLLLDMTGHNVPLGLLDATFHRDDFRRHQQPLIPNATQVPFIIEQKNVVLIDDVLFTGRTVRAALDAMNAFGRPNKVELLILIDRKYTHELPVAPDYTGMQVDSVQSQQVRVSWQSEGDPEDSIWLISQAVTTL